MLGEPGRGGSVQILDPILLCPPGHVTLDWPLPFLCLGSGGAVRETPPLPPRVQWAGPGLPHGVNFHGVWLGLWRGCPGQPRDTAASAPAGGSAATSRP